MKIKTVILCGGQGTRIRDVADDIPKPMIRIGEMPVLWHIMKTYAHSGFKDFVLCLGYKSWTIKNFFLNYRLLSADLDICLSDPSSVHFHNDAELDWKITLAETGEKAGTGARLKRIERYIHDLDLVCVTYGDGVADLNILQLIEFHCSHGKLATVTGVRPAGRFGVISTSAEDGVNTVESFEEKPQAKQGWISGGYFVFSPKVWRYFSDAEELLLERGPLQQLARDGQLVMYEHQDFWYPMDTYRDWKILNDLWDSGKAPWKRP